MCGIILALSVNGSIEQEKFNQARDSMKHRGPDAADSIFLQNGRVAIGHRRLSIMDLSEAANQPMQLGSLWITYNGEIYNYPELRKILEAKGCRFRTNTDTEALLHGYQVWGEGLCNHLTGMFSFAIWNDVDKSLFLARDHIGQKPLYYTQINNKLFIVASEIKAIKKLVGQVFELRQESILDIIIFDCVPEPFTWYQGIECLMPGHCMLVKTNQHSLSYVKKNYWNFVPDPNPRPVTENEAMERMGAEIEKAVKSHLLADVEVGTFLSGGADSTCIATLASQYINHPLKTFSVGFGSSDEDELPLARETAHRIGSIHREDKLSEADFRACLESLLRIFDQPFADTSLVPTERVSALAAQDVKVVLTGDGGDEIFGGYDLGWYLSPFLAQRGSANISVQGLKIFLKTLSDKMYYMAMGPARWQLRENFLRRLGQPKRIKRFLNSDLSVALSNYEPRWPYYKYRESGLDPIRQAQWLHTKIILPSKMLSKVDRCSMSHSLETRAPFLSPSLVETMLNLPTPIRNPESHWYKGLFRTWLKDKISDNVLYASKRGFAPPLSWYPITQKQLEAGLLQTCIKESIVQASAWSTIKQRPKLLWKFLQVEHALKEGLFQLPLSSTSRLVTKDL